VVVDDRGKRTVRILSVYGVSAPGLLKMSLRNRLSTGIGHLVVAFSVFTAAIRVSSPGGDSPVPSVVLPIVSRGGSVVVPSRARATTTGRSLSSSAGDTLRPATTSGPRATAGVSRNLSESTISGVRSPIQVALVARGTESPVEGRSPQSVVSRSPVVQSTPNGGPGSTARRASPSDLPAPDQSSSNRFASCPPHNVVTRGPGGHE
ncbi:unnamed protein product, partial [Amoebophrya sp. A25]